MDSESGPSCSSSGLIALLPVNMRTARSERQLAACGPGSPMRSSITHRQTWFPNRAFCSLPVTTGWIYFALSSDQTVIKLPSYIGDEILKYALRNYSSDLPMPVINEAISRFKFVLGETFYYGLLLIIGLL